MITVSTIANASEIQLLCLTYELFLADVKEAITLKGNQRKGKVQGAREVLTVLTENLNFEVSLSQDLFKVYVYVQNILINAYEDDKKLSECYQLIEMIYKGYKELEEQEDSNANTHRAIMQNAQSIYAGMTYGKGYLNEVTMDEPGRGFKA